MKIMRGLFLFGVLLTVPFLAQEMPKIQKVTPKEKQTVAKETTTGAPKIVVEKDVHDFGKIDKSEKVTANFKFRNEGAGVLEIMDVKTSCGCTSAKPEKRVYQPGEEGNIEVSFNPSRFQGAITKTVTILTNDPEKSRYTCKIQADIIVDVMVSPRVLFVQNLKRGENRTETITVSTERLESLDLSGLESDRDFVNYELVKVDGKKYEIKVTVDANKIPMDQKRVFANLSYKTNSKGQSDIKTRVHVTIQDPVEVQPPAIYFFGSKQGFEREIKVRLKSTVDKDLKIDKVNLEMTPAEAKDYVTAEVIQDERVGLALKVKLGENAEKGKFQGKITLETGLPEQPLVQIPLKGSVI